MISLPCNYNMYSVYKKSLSYLCLNHVSSELKFLLLLILHIGHILPYFLN